MVFCSAAFALIAFTVTSLYWPSQLFSAPPEIAVMLIGFPILTALPMELVYRALFFRRYGHLIQGETAAIILGAAATSLGYAVLSGNIGGVIFGFALGGVLGWAYLKTGNFAVSVVLHWAAAAALYLIGPGIL
jgi:membrane protease YdiL (CAAX protease family)